MQSAYTQAALVVLLLFLAPFWAAAAEPGSRRLGETAYVVQETSQPALLHALMNASVSLLEFQVSRFKQLRELHTSTATMCPPAVAYHATICAHGLRWNKGCCAGRHRAVAMQGHQGASCNSPSRLAYSHDAVAAHKAAGIQHSACKPQLLLCM